MTTHTPGPWRADAWASHAETSILSDAPLPEKVGDQKVLPGPFVIAECNCSLSSAQDEANAARIVECVNALAGIEDAAAFMERARRLEVVNSELRGRIGNVIRRTAELEVIQIERDELAMALRNVLPLVRVNGDHRAQGCVMVAEAALAKVTP